MPGWGVLRPSRCRGPDPELRPQRWALSDGEQRSARRCARRGARDGGACEARRADGRRESPDAARGGGRGRRRTARSLPRMRSRAPRSGDRHAARSLSRCTWNNVRMS